MGNTLSYRYTPIDLCIKAIALPTQSITLEKDAKAPTTKRKLTFTDLVAHLKHHNSNVKKGIFTDSLVS
jgi:pre-rRNA-processing protein IPI1